MLEIVIVKYKSVLQILIIGLVIIGVYFSIFLKEIRAHMIENWDQYKNHPLTMLVSGFIKPVEGESSIKTTIKNFISIITGICKKIFNMLMRPIYAIMGIFLKIFNLLKSVLDKIRQQLNVIRGFLFKMFEKVMLRIQNSVAAIVYFFLKLREGLKRTLGLFNVMIYSMEHSYLFLQSLVKGPVMAFGHVADKMAMSMSMFTFGFGGIPMWHVAMSMCFDPKTKIKLISGEYRSLNKIQTGEILDMNVKVLSVIKNQFEKPIDLYNLQGVYVTGDHLVCYNKKVIRVRDHPLVLSGKKSDSIVTLVTDKGIIKINDIIFKDYLDNHDLIKNSTINKYIEYCLNKQSQIKKNQNICTNLLYGFKSLEYLKSKSLDNITGYVTILKNTIDVYKINNFELSGNMLVFYKKKWIRVINHPKAVFIGKNKTEFCHVITKNEKVYFKNNLITRDFTETRDPIINYNIDSYMEKM
tara:strand:- start:9904 stop:11307 length:1404 start_codon:yes stop_codon:yes gene_type:complete